MAASDPKAAPLAGDLKEFALTLPTTTFPKNFFCALCGQLAFDSWKLLCCNKSICTSCYEKFEFPTTCSLCDHSPLEAETCTVNKSLRNTMRVWLQKQKKKEEAKNTPVIATPVSATPATEAPTSVDPGDKPVESFEDGLRVEDATEQQASATGGDGDASLPAESVAPQEKENTSAPQNDEAHQTITDSQNPDQSAEPTSAGEDPNAAQNAMNGSMDGSGMYGDNGMFNGMNGMPGQFGFGFPNQSMGFNGMNPMNGMPNMMGGGWNSMNAMDFNNNMMPNMPYGGFGGSMGMPGMNDMSAMNNMNFGGGYGNGWNGGMNGGYGNFNGYNNPMGGYNQSGGQYPQMMNQFPKNNFQNQNRFPANGAAFSQQKNNRRGSYGNYGNQNGNQNGPGFQNAHSRPGSRSGPPQNRDGESPAGDAEAAPETHVEGDQTKASADPAQEGKAEAEGTSESVVAPVTQADGMSNANELTGTADESNEMLQSGGLNQIQTVDSADNDNSQYEQPMMNDNIMPSQPYQQGMGGGYSNQHNFNGPYGGGMGFNQHNNYGPGGGYNPAYGAATVLTGEPKGVGVVGAPTGPRAMREGRPNTGFSSRANNARYNSHVPAASVVSAPEPPASPLRRGRASPQRDDTLRTKERSPTRSPSRSRTKEDDRNDHRERSRSTERESKQKQVDQSRSPSEYDTSRKERRKHRSSRYDDHDDRDARDDEHDDYHRDDKESRGDRTRSTSVESRHRSRRDKDRHRSSRSHHDRSRERRHRHRSRSPVEEEKYDDDEVYANGTEESGGRRKSRSDKDKNRERDRDRSRDRERERDRKDRHRDRDYEYEKDKDRSRDKDRDRKRSRREKDDDYDERDYEDDRHRSSRRSRKDRDRERDRDRDREDRDSEKKTKESESTPARTVSPPLNAPTGPSADGFSIRGFSKTKRSDPATTAAKPMPPPPTGPRAFQPPKGPAADRNKDTDRRDHRRKSSVSSLPPTPTTPTSKTTESNHYAADRESHAKERVDRDNRDKVQQLIHGRATGRSHASSTSRPSLSSKRSRDEVDDNPSTNAPASEGNKEKEVKIPTGPSAHRDKRRKSGDNAIASLFTAGLRKQAKGGSRGLARGGVKTEGDAERELERVERERDRRVW